MKVLTTLKVLKARNVNDLFIQGLELLEQDGVNESSRAGPVRVAPWPVVSIYERPCERVLFDEKRDANPFFHLMEGLWMLSGSNDPRFLDHYIHDFGARFAEPNGHNPDGIGVIHGAYGHRWRSTLGFDQLDQIVLMLRNDPGTRQAVLQMWDASQISDAWHGGIDGNRVSGSDDLGGIWKDRPCNTHVYFRIRDVGMRTPDELLKNPSQMSQETVNKINTSTRLLDMTVLCRSNDIIWGAYGANAVHFSMLQEYVAGRVGVGVGTMFQFSNNYHGYFDALDKIGDPMQLSGSDPYDAGVVSASPMGADWGRWDEDLKRFMQWHDNLWESDTHLRGPDNCFNIWFHTVAVPVALANWFWKHKRRDEARAALDIVNSTDWKLACISWMERKIK